MVIYLVYTHRFRKGESTSKVLQIADNWRFCYDVLLFFDVCLAIKDNHLEMSMEIV